MQQTVRQRSLPLNNEKWARITETAAAYARQKDAFLVEYGHVKYLHYLGEKRKLRDKLVSAGFVSPFGLQARQWKLALEDALYTLERQWEAAIAEVKGRLYRHEGLTDEEKHYANWLLYKHEKHGRDWQRIQSIFTGEDVINEEIKLDVEGRTRARKYLKRVFCRVPGKKPRVKKTRSFTIDQQMYRVFATEKRQYIAVATLNPGKRVVIPLAGIYAIKGNLRVVLLPDEKCVEIHLTREPRTYPPGEGEAGIDLGVTEVFTDDTGRKYRSEYGEALQRISDHLLDKGRKRQKLWALYRKNLEQDSSKARRIKEHNLGTTKQRKQNRKYRACCENEINRAFNELYRERRPRIIAYEDLAHLRGKAKNKGLSRKVSNWQRNTIKKRLEYKNHIYSVTDPGPTNAAYTSQQCPQCGWVDSRNRHGDTFKCRKCGFAAGADHVAALNLKARLFDIEITRYTPYRKVKEILLQRYQQKQAK